MTIPTTPIAVRILVCRFERLDSWNIPNLAAPYWRVYWNREPNWRVRLGEQVAELAPDRVVVIPPETSCAAESRGPSTHFYLHFTAEYPYERVQPSIHQIRVGRSERAIVDQVIASTGSPARASVLAHQLCYLGLGCVPAGDLPTAAYSLTVRSVIAAIEARLSDPPGNADLARTVGMNVNAFIRRFQRETGVTPQAWSAARRIALACTLLHHSKMSIDEIAEETGFCDRFHFSRVFKAQRHMGPAQFRKMAAGA